MSSSSATSKKRVSLTFRGFDVSAEEVIAQVGVNAASFGNRGYIFRAGRQRHLPRSYACFEIEVANDYALKDMLPALFERLGGVERLFQVRSRIHPEFLEIDFYLPVVSQYEEQSQEGYLPEEVIADTFRLNASIGFAFF